MKEELIKTTHDKITLLSTLNVLQPMKRDDIVTGLAETLHIEKVGELFDSLLHDALIIETSDGQYVVSQRWLKTANAAPLRKARDQQRLYQLFDRSKKGVRK